jgi:ATP-dependent exoDNAse (exonuclease V) beta subunit
MPRSFTNLMIRASAGTGKTFQLSNRFLALLHQGVAVDHILATTFTRKAAREILDRVLVRLAEGATSDEHCRRLAEHLGEPGLSRERCLELLTGICRNLHRLRISTLDSFFTQIARSFTFELGLPPGWQIVEAVQDSVVREQAIDQVLREEGHGRLLTLVHLLTKGQASRGIHPLVRSTVDELYELFRETTAEAWTSIARPRGLDEDQLQSCLEALRRWECEGARLVAARDKDIQLVESKDWETFVGQGPAAKILEGDNHYYRKPLDPELVAIYQKLIEHARSVLVGRIASQTEGTYRLLARFHERYQRLKHEQRAIRFDDVACALAGAVNLEHAGPIAYRLDARTDHLLLDEFQDTSIVQWQVLLPLARRVSSRRVHSHCSLREQPDPLNTFCSRSEQRPSSSFFCVGDIKQAIYAWRGGNAEIFDTLEEELGEIASEPLDTTRRCSPSVIETVNRVFSGLADHPHLERERRAVSRWSDQFRPHKTAYKGPGGYACLMTACRAGEDQTQADVTLSFASGAIAQLVERAPGLSVGVLVRTNKGVSKLIYELRRSNVPASEEGGNPLTDSAAVQLVLSLLRVADHPGDTVSRFHVAHSPLGTALGLARHDDDRAAAQLAGRVRQTLMDDGYGPAIDGWARLLAGHCDPREAGRVRQLVQLAYEFQGRATTRAVDFVRLAEDQRVAEPSSADVRVMTIHQSKGLEFDIVVLPDLDFDLIGTHPPIVVQRASPGGPVQRVCRYVDAKLQAILPAAVERMFREADDRAVTETLCVLYVALTRAKHALYMIIAPSTTSEKHLPRTCAGLVRGALTDRKPLGPESVVYEHGDRAWYRHAAIEPLAETQSAGSLPLVVRLAGAPARARRGLQSATPSGLAASGRGQLADRLAGLSAAGAEYGTLIHAWMERIKWLDDGPPGADALRKVAAGLDTWQLDVEASISEFLSMLGQPHVARLLRRAQYNPPRELAVDKAILAELPPGEFELEVFAERRIAVQDDHLVLRGSIDRLVLMRSRDKIVAAELIDFKTDRIDKARPDAIQAKVDHYRPQVEAYRRAVARMLRLEQRHISAKLAFLAIDLVVGV